MRSIDIRNSEDLLKKWLMRAHINIQTHYNAGNRYRGYHYWVGVPLILATVILGSDIIDTTFTQSVLSKVVTGIIGVVATLLAGFQTLFKFEERRNNHILAAQRYGEIARKIERMLSGSLEINDQELQKIEDQINKAVRESSLPPTKIFKKKEESAHEYYRGQPEV